jgi:hypothetical protein
MKTTDDKTIRSALIATPRPLPSVDEVARTICDGISKGNIQWDDASSTLRSDCLHTATAILTLLGGSAR